MVLPPRILIRKLFMMVRGVKKLSFCGPVELVSKGNLQKSMR